MPHCSFRAQRAPLGAILMFALAGCGASTGHSPEGDSSETTGGSAAVSTALPESYNPGQGETAWGVYLATLSEGDATEGRRLLAELEARGVTGGGMGELSCDRGAAAALGGHESDTVVSVGFRTRAEAEQFVAAWGSPVLGTAEFVAYCRD